MNTEQTRVEPLLSVADVSEILGLKPRTIYRLVIDHKLQAVRVGDRKLMFEPATVRADIRGHLTGR